jgi:RNA methyltransferase, TrmH family
LKVREHLTSAKNPKINNLRLLQKPRVRREQGLLVLEGFKETERAHRAGYDFSSVFFVPEMIPDQEIGKFVSEQTEVYSITPSLFQKIAYRENTFGAVAIAKQKGHGLDSLHLKANPLILVLESVEKPGNLGAVLRTADAAAVDAVIVCDAQTDIYNPNVIRSSIGCLFTVPLAVAGSEEVISYLKTNRINIYCTALTASKTYTEIDFSKPSAIVMGTEATGLSDRWLYASDQNIIIPMAGIADSLNVSTSAAIVTFEARRQRGFA